MKITCEKCDFWNLHPFRNPDALIKTEDCRRRAPVMLPNPDGSGMYRNAEWPRTDPTDWCGDGEPISDVTQKARQAERSKMKKSPWNKYFPIEPPERHA